MAKDILKIYGFSRNDIVDDLPIKELLKIRRRANRGYGRLAVVFPDMGGVQPAAPVIIITNDGNIDLRDGNLILADGNLI